MGTIELYLIGLAISTNLIFVWFFTSIKYHLFRFLKIVNKNCEIQNVDNELILKNRFFGELLSCPICLSTHISFWTAFIIYLMSDLTFIFILVATFSYPAIIYLFYCLANALNAYSDR